MTAWKIIYEHRGVVILVSGLVVSSAVGSLPDPKPESSDFYVWFYNFSHSLVSAIKVLRPEVKEKP